MRNDPTEETPRINGDAPPVFARPHPARAEGPDGAWRRAMAYHATPEMADRLWARVPSRTEGSCWDWSGSRDAQGYGIFFISKSQGIKRRGMAHRLAYELARSETVPDDMQIDHLCRNTSCVNPDHLEVVSARTNSRRSLSESGRNFRKTHCVHGHPFRGSNLRISTAGKRVCQTCSRRRSRAVSA